MHSPLIFPWEPMQTPAIQPTLSPCSVTRENKFQMIRSLFINVTAQIRVTLHRFQISPATKALAPAQIQHNFTSSQGWILCIAMEKATTLQWFTRQIALTASYTLYVQKTLLNQMCIISISNYLTNQIFQTFLKLLSIIETKLELVYRQNNCKLQRYQ